MLSVYLEEDPAQIIRISNDKENIVHNVPYISVTTPEKLDLMLNGLVMISGISPLSCMFIWAASFIAFDLLVPTGPKGCSKCYNAILRSVFKTESKTKMGQSVFNVVQMYRTAEETIACDKNN